MQCILQNDSGLSSTVREHLNVTVAGCLWSFILQVRYHTPLSGWIFYFRLCSMFFLSVLCAALRLMTQGLYYRWTDLEKGVHSKTNKIGVYIVSHPEFHLSLAVRAGHRNCIRLRAYTIQANLTGPLFVKLRQMIQGSFVCGSLLTTLE